MQDSTSLGNKSRAMKADYTMEMTPKLLVYFGHNHLASQQLKVYIEGLHGTA
ncbi:predicted protein [Sclerotinia sclerotiorum 1980 UF-70]|uniref:Uncharacterized protein n=1 Tax=Sclerotinia sclerotiorum (strain ATCC 18683 / 1980 / Ss-1) TaxID=665079 RepID=A7E9J5_SCLS1|nr:predicted protein [Sclerotinia sclerotiorum 1980 UF-70]EDN97047.1 predicted protein [Sclerotinia sclerotiorum 1980 UF-70]